jgi:hypothetical protein
MSGRFTKEEVWGIIKELPPDKAPGPGGFTMRFLQVAWDNIRPDLMAALDAFWWQDTRDLHATNEALMILLPKSADAEAMKDYRLISLIHVVGKLIYKLLANRLALRIGSLVHGTQCAFIKGRSIHENFKFMLSSARLMHARRKANVLFKVDLSKAFDSVAWAFFMEIL